MSSERDTRLRAEFHCHTIFSGDSSNKPADLVTEARRRGLGRLAVTDHNTIRGALAAKALDAELVIIGEEIMTSRGELLGYFLHEEIPARLSPEETIKRLRAQGAFIAVPHPFDIRRHAFALRDLEWLAQETDAFEVFNARCFSAKTNEKAARFARERGLAKLAGSDAHSLVELGLASVELAEFNNASELRAALKESTFHARQLSAGEHIRASALIAAGRVWKMLKGSQD